MDLFDHNKLLKERVKSFLLTNPDMRDDDHILTVAIWRQDLIRANKFEKKMGALEFLKLYSIGTIGQEISNAFSIVRYRQIIQRECPELRGERYLERKKNETTIREKVRNNDL
jgi:hypothetical protein